MSLLKIITHPNPFLRQVSKEVDAKDLTSKSMQKLLLDMTQTMLAKDGIGLAAPQIHQSIRLVIVNTKFGPLALFNPKIIKKSLTKEWEEEGCLSVPHTFGEVKRYKTIQCQYLNQDGEVKKIEAKGLLARVIQHEMDHLDGVLFIDKARNITEETYTM